MLLRSHLFYCLCKQLSSKCGNAVRHFFSHWFIHSFIHSFIHFIHFLKFRCPISAGIGFNSAAQRCQVASISRFPSSGLIEQKNVQLHIPSVQLIWLKTRFHVVLPCVQLPVRPTLPSNAHKLLTGIAMEIPCKIEWNFHWMTLIGVDFIGDWPSDPPVDNGNVVSLNWKQHSSLITKQKPVATRK